jgi:hypothetical protein
MFPFEAMDFFLFLLLHIFIALGLTVTSGTEHLFTAISFFLHPEQNINYHGSLVLEPFLFQEHGT